MDFNFKLYSGLLETLLRQGFSFSLLTNLLVNKESGSSILRHDVDRLPLNSLEFAKIQHKLGIKGSYFFRSVPQSFNEEIIETIAGLSHEVGYHYEDLSLVSQKLKTKKRRIKEKEIIELGMDSFERNLEKFRKLVPINSICMHGSPLSRWDSRILWKYYDYKDYGINCEPYFDVNFDQMLYLTDTGRRWDGSSVSVRDKGIDGTVKTSENSPLTGKNLLNSGIEDEEFKNWIRKPISGSLMNMTSQSVKYQSLYKFKKTNEIIHSLQDGSFARQVMMTFHPQRWTDKPLPWMKELVWQNVKNVGKYFLIRMRG